MMIVIAVANYPGTIANGLNNQLFKCNYTPGVAFWSEKPNKIIRTQWPLRIKLY